MVALFKFYVIPLPINFHERRMIRTLLHVRVRMFVMLVLASVAC